MAGDPTNAHLGVSPELAALIQESREAIRHQKDEAEAVQREKVAQAEALARARESSVRRLRRGVVASLTLAGVAAGVAGLALWYRQQAETSAGAAQTARTDAENEAAAARRAQADAENKANDLRRTLIELALGKGSWSEARRLIDEALAAGHPDAARLRLNKVKALCALHRLDEARQELQELSRQPNLGPRRGSVRLWQADLVLSTSPTNDQSDEIGRAIREDLSAAEEDYARALTAETMSQVVDRLESALKADPLYQRANAVLGMTYLLLGRTTKARERIAFGEFVFPDDPTFGALRLFLEASAGDPAAVAAATAAFERKPGLSDDERAAALTFVKLMAALKRLEANFNGTEKSNPLVLMWSLNEAIDGLGPKFKSGAGIALPLPPLFLTVWGRLWPVLGALMAIAPTAAAVTGADRELTGMTKAHPDAFLLFLQGIVLAKGERFADAASVLARAADPRMDSFVRIHRAASTLRVKCEIELAYQPGGGVQQEERALRELQTLIDHGEVHIDYAKILAEFALERKQPELAGRALAGWERQEPTDRTVRLLRAQIEAGRRNFGRVLEIADHLLKEKPDDAEALKWRDRALTEMIRQAEELKKGPKGGPNP